MIRLWVWHFRHLEDEGFMNGQTARNLLMITVHYLIMHDLIMHKSNKSLGPASGNALYLICTMLQFSDTIPLT